MRASARRGLTIGGAPTVTFGGACTLLPVGEEDADGLALGGHGNIPPLLGTALGACSVKLGVRHPNEK